MTEETPKAKQGQEAATNGAAAESPVDWQDRYLRLAAELDNSKKAYERAYARRAQQERERLVRDLLPLADNLERAMEHATPVERETALYDGVELTLRDLRRTLERHGVERRVTAG